MGKGYQHDAKMDAEIHDFFECFQKRRKLKHYCFFNRKRGSDHAKRYQQSIENRCKIKARKVPKGAKRERQLMPKSIQNSKKEPKESRGGANNPKRAGKKACQKQGWKKEEKWSQNILARRNARGPPFA